MPKTWEQRKLGEMVGVYDGVHQTPEYQSEGIMFLSVENIATMTSSKFISEEAFERDYKVYPEKGDILMTRIGDVGTPNVVETTEKIAFYVSLALLKPYDIDSYFLSNSIQSPFVQKGIRNRTLLSAIPQKINKDEVGKVDILFPTNTEEQKQIGEYFSNLDNLITLHQRKDIMSNRISRIYKSHFIVEDRMLKIIFGNCEEAIYNTAVYFKNTYQDDWITDELSIRMIEDVDKSTVVGPRLIQSPVLGAISPRELSGGVKTLILVNQMQDKIFNASTCGDNCAKWLLEIGRKTNVTVNLRHIMDFGDGEFEIEVVNNHQVVHNMKELLDIADLLI